MTQSVTNNLNNIEQMLTSQPTVAKPAETITSGIDKAKYAFESNLDKAFLTISDIKNKLSSGGDKETLTGFREILSQTTNEVNVETSLDLTLARDINEIITQLKEAVEKAVEAVEEASEETAVEYEENTANLSAEELEDIEQAESDSELSFEQLLAFADKTVEPVVEKASVLTPAEEETTEVLDVIETTKGEIIEFAENIADEVTTAKTSEDTQSDDLEALLDEDMLKELNIESIKAETDTEGGDSLMQNETPGENALKAMINADNADAFDIKIETAQNSQNSQPVQAKPAEVNPGRLIDQVAKHMEGLQNNSKISIVLNPESLGKVDIQLLSTKEGLTAQFTVTTQEARDLLMKGLDGLKDTLASHGVGFDNVSVKVSDSQKSEYNQDWTEQEGSRGGNKGQGQPNKEEKEKGLFEQMMAQTKEDENGKV